MYYFPDTTIQVEDKSKTCSLLSRASSYWVRHIHRHLTSVTTAGVGESDTCSGRTEGEKIYFSWELRKVGQGQGKQPVRATMGMNIYIGLITCQELF